jgi:hypothetical protein
LKIFGSPTARLDHFAIYPVHGNSSPDFAELRLQPAIRWQAYVDANGCSFGLSTERRGFPKSSAARSQSLAYLCQNHLHRPYPNLGMSCRN